MKKLNIISKSFSRFKYKFLDKDKIARGIMWLGVWIVGGLTILIGYENIVAIKDFFKKTKKSFRRE